MNSSPLGYIKTKLSQFINDVGYLKIDTQDLTEYLRKNTNDPEQAANEAYSQEEFRERLNGYVSTANEDNGNKSPLDDYILTGAATGNAPTSAMTSGEIDAAIGSIFAGLDIAFTNDLSTIESPNGRTIYFLNRPGTETDAYEEYIYYGGKFELIGTAKIDMSAYMTRDAFNQEGFVQISQLSSVAYGKQAGDYTALTNKPAIPTDVADFTDKDTLVDYTLAEKEVNARSNTNYKRVENLTITGGTWVKDPNAPLADFPFKASVAVEGINGTDWRLTNYYSPTLEGGKICPTAATEDGKVDLWAMENITEDMQITYMDFLYVLADAEIKPPAPTKKIATMMKTINMNPETMEEKPGTFHYELVQANPTKLTFSNNAIPQDKIATATLVSDPLSEEKIYLYNTTGSEYVVAPENEGVTIMANENCLGMFLFCEQLTSLDVSNFDTSKVTDMSGMFGFCHALTSLDLSNFNTSNVTNMKGMFLQCMSLTSLDLSNFDTSKVTDMSYMLLFIPVSSLDLSSFDTSSVTDMTGMFSGCKSLTSLNISNFNVSNVTDMSLMFEDCTALTSLDLSNFNASKVTNMTEMFRDCTALKSLNLSNFNASNVTNMSNIFNGCTSLTTLDLSNFNASSITDISYLFSNCTSLTTLNLNNFDISNVTYMSGMFRDCTALTSLDLSNLNTSKVTNMCELFVNCTALTSLDLSNFNVSNVTDMSLMFEKCTALTSLDLSNFDTSKVTEMTRMFRDCTALTSLNLSNFNTSNVIYMVEMFCNCTSLTSLNLSNFDASSATDMRGMFDSCTSLTSLDLSNFNANKVTNTNAMFFQCTSLTSLNLGNFNISGFMDHMFRACTSLTSLDLSNFDTSKATNMSYMFYDCTKLTNIIYGEKFVINDGCSTSGMYDSCPANRHPSYVEK